MAFCTTTELLVGVGKAGTATDEERALMDFLRPMIERRIKDEVNSEVELATFTELHPDKTRSKDRSDLVDYDRSGQRVLEFRGRGDQLGVLQVRNPPVRAVLEIREAWLTGGGADPAAPLLDPSAYYVDWVTPPDPDNNNYGLCLSGQIVKPYMWWSTFHRSTRVRYVGGFTPAELARDGPYCQFREAAILTAAKVFRTLEAMFSKAGGLPGVGPITQEGLDGMTFNYDTASVGRLIGQAMSLSPEVQERLAPLRNYGLALG